MAELEFSLEEATAAAKNTFGVEPYLPWEAITHACGLLDVIKSEWGDSWTEHDQRTRAGLSALVTSHFATKLLNYKEQR